MVQQEMKNVDGMILSTNKDVVITVGVGVFKLSYNKPYAVFFFLPS